jgi:large subunit ribosomal protein L25
VDIPENIEVDVSSLMLNQALRLRDVTESVKWKPVSEPDLMIVHVVAPKAEAEPVAEVEALAAPAEPEVIKKGKAEKEEEGEAEGKAKK